MRKYLALLFTLLLVVSLGAQQRSGNIYGKVVDTEGTPLPGVTVTLTSPYFAPMTAVTSAEGTFRFLSLPPSREYTIKLELTGFKTVVQTGIVVEVGANANLTFTMEPGGIEEEITVTAVTPVVDTKKTSVGTNVTQEILQGLPTARDPWVILQMAPSVIVDRENVGGAESGQQSNYVARGANTYNNNVWAMDGIVITDPAAIGASPSYYDFDAFEEMQISVGGNDVTVQTGGIALNMVTRRGSNRITFGGRFYLTDGKFQAKNTEKVAEIKAIENPENRSNLFQGVNYIRNNKDYGFNLGFPIVKDKAWAWFSYGIQDIKTTTVYGTPDDTLLENYVGKINVQPFQSNRLEIFYHSGGKKKWGRSASAALPDGYAQQGRYYFGSPILKIQDEQMIGNNLFLSFKFAFSDAGFSLIPMMDRDWNDVPMWNVTEQRWYGSEWRYYVERPVYQYNFMAQYFNDELLGASHEFKFGVDYAQRKQYVESVYNGNMTVSYNYRETDTAWDIDNDSIPDYMPLIDPAYKNTIKYFSFWRGYYRDQRVKALGLYFSDTITFDRFTLILGLRYDYQIPYLAPFTLEAMDGGAAWQKIADDETRNKLDQLLPGLEIPKRYHYYYDPATNSISDKKFYWSVFSPRIGFTWDITGDGKTLLKINLAQYGDFMGTGWADWASPSGTGGWMDFWWWDQNRDGVMNYKELYWLWMTNPPAGTSYYSPYRVFDDSGNFIGDNNLDGDGDNFSDAAGYYWGGYDPNNPQNFGEPYTSTRKGVGSSRTSEAMVTLEREIMTNFAVQLVGTYRKYDKYNWTLKYWLNEDGTRTYPDSSETYFADRGTPAPSYYNSDTGEIFIPDTKKAPEHHWYTATAAYRVYSPYSERQPRPNYYMEYFGIDLIWNKRLANKWMLNGSFSWQWQAQHYGEGSYLDPTTIWAFDGKPQAAYIGGASGKINQYTYTRWMFKLSGLYQLPFDINISGTFNAREGWVLTEYFTLVDYRIPASDSRSNTIYMDYFGTDRLPIFYNFNLRVEKLLRVGNNGRIYIMLDVFNVLNKMIENRRYMKNWGTVRVYGDAEGNIDWTQTTFTPNPTYNALNEVLNPRVARIGVRFEF
ncbi:MAG: TonB-dependent receptor [Candidatus Aminicenantes bacterium]|nr:TonB-dependent receptor [Candidatus Aminicenantes bacterium]